MKKAVWLAVVTALCLCASALAAELVPSGFSYAFDSGLAVPIGYVEGMDTLTLNAEVSGYPIRFDEETLHNQSGYTVPESFVRIVIAQAVTEVPDTFGRNMHNIGQIVFEGAPARIGQEAFSWLGALEEVTLPEGVQSVAAHAFRECAALESISLPGSLVAFEPGAFSGCRALSTISLGKDNPRLELIDGALYTRGEEKTLLLVPNDGRTAFETAPGTVRVAKGAFAFGNQIRSLVLSPGMREVDTHALDELEWLETLYLPASLNGLDTSYWYKPVLKRIEVEQGHPFFQSRDGVLYSNGEMAYYPAANRVHIEIAFEGNLTVTGRYKNNTYIQSVSIGMGYEALPESCFFRCAGLKSAALPLGLKRIDNAAFSNCVDLAYISLPATLEKIGEYAFYNCPSLQKISVPKGVLSLEQHAFSGCTALRSVSLTEGLLGIETGAFWGCKSLARIGIPSSVKAIGEYAFLGCAPDLILHGQTGSEAYYHAYEYGLRFESDADEAPYQIWERLTVQMRAGVFSAPETGASTPLYSKASTDSKQLGRYPNGTTALILSVGRDFTQVQIGDSTGFVQNKYFVDTTALTHLVPVIYGRQAGGNSGKGFSLYEQPFEGSASLFIASDPKVLILNTVGVWYYVRAEGRLGYVLANQLDAAGRDHYFMYGQQDPVEGQPRYMVVVNPDHHDRLHLRQAQSTQSKSLGRYFSGTQVELLDPWDAPYDRQWAYVRVDGKEGYMLMAYLRYLSNYEGREVLFGNG